jgi:hypothetical protein
MTANELTKKYLAWWQPRNPLGRLWANRTGFLKTLDGNRLVPCGVPPPIPGRKGSGGGSDLIGIDRGIFLACEIKTIDDTLKKHQADFLSLIIRLGGRSWIVQENHYSKLGFDEIVWNENMTYLVK